MIGSEYISYATVAAFGAIALFHFCANIRRYAPNTEAYRFFRAAILSSALYAIMEFFFVFHESGLITSPIYCYMTEVIYSLGSLGSGFFWFMSSEIEQQEATVRTHRNRILCAIPFVIMAILNITTPWHHLLFWFTPDGHYERGILCTPFVVIAALYTAKSGIFAWIKARKKENYLYRSQYMTYFWYMLGIVITQLFQTVFASVLPFRVLGAVVLFFLVQEKTIKDNVFIDLVTNTNNRTAMDKYLKAHFENADESFTLIMIDLDNFKQINDRYGHNIGDVALHLVASAFLKSIPPSLFFGRFGGDEFVIIGHTAFSEDVHCIMEQAKQNIQKLCEKENMPFTPGFSYGFSCKTQDIHSIPELINRADTAMYAEKQKHKTAAKV